MALEAEDVEALEEALSRYQGLDHLKVKRRGESLTIFSGESPNQHRHARLTHVGSGQWGVSFPHHTGRWEKTPLMGNLDEVVETLVTNFGFYLEDLSAGQGGNP